MEDTCPPGQILRKGYRRKGYYREDGSYVKGSKIPPVCINDRGKPGKGPKTLPQPNDEFHFSSYGYRVNKPIGERRAALIKAANAVGARKAAKRLGLIRNLTSTDDKSKKVKDTLSRDVDFLWGYALSGPDPPVISAIKDENEEMTGVKLIDSVYFQIYEILDKKLSDEKYKNMNYYLVKMHIPGKPFQINYMADANTVILLFDDKMEYIGNGELLIFPLMTIKYYLGYQGYRRIYTWVPIDSKFFENHVNILNYVGFRIVKKGSGNISFCLDLESD